MIYNFNLGIGWASSGVEYAQSYRANILRNIGEKAKFIFVDMFPRDNIQELAQNIGFLDEEIIWLYTFFTDFKIAPVSYTLSQLEDTFSSGKFTFIRDENTAKYVFESKNNFCKVYFSKTNTDCVHRVEIVSNGKLIRKDYYTYAKLYSEYYAPLDGTAHLYQRRFFNTDGTVAYEEIFDGDKVMYKFTDQIICSKEELVGYMVRRLNLTSSDIVILDRTTGIGQAVVQNSEAAKVGIVIHAEHFNEGATDENNILWNNFYEYSFAMSDKVDFYLTATETQKQLLKSQFAKYQGTNPCVVAIPVGSIDELKYPKENRRKYSLVTASRLANEKHVDWIVAAVAQVHEVIPDVTLDIYGKGVAEGAIVEQINRLGAREYIRMMGQQDLTEVYQNYEAYVSASQSEGFGLSLLEAIGAGLPIIGFDVRYGNQNFIEDGKNGYLVPYDAKMCSENKIVALKEHIIKLFYEAEIEKFRECSYEVANRFLTVEVESKWKNLIDQMK